MDLSGIIFVALAVAWAAYLIPKALKHHDDVVRSRSVDRFSHTMRVLARREPVRSAARSVLTPSRADSRPIVETKPTSSRTTSAQRPASREATRRATARRRNVLGTLLGLNLVVGVLAFAGVAPWTLQVAPVALVVVWLVLCRVMVKSERAALPARRPAAAPYDPMADAETEVVPVITDELHDAPAEPVDPHAWDLVPVTLPTYVDKPVAPARTVRTISLDDSDVWTSGRTEVDAEIARQADEARRTDSETDGDQRALGS